MSRADDVTYMHAGLSRFFGEAWAEIHRTELQHDWDLLQSGQPPVKIEPLR